ncbi:MAG: pilus assembly protein N-terminal domain-containing protein [Planctomycetaceae bacterium]|nr:pilus assembly protein N-terminal domain-containing protein [Planctomycetaceae bacterium]
MSSTLFCGFILCFALPANAQSQPLAQNRTRTLQLQTVQSSRKLDARIVSMPQVEQKLDIIQNRSQLVKTRHRVTRMAIADPSVIDVAPYEDDEFAIIGNQLGSTTLTLWFEDDDKPLIYEVTTIRDPNIEEQVRLDYGKLERKLAILFPNSKVYLIPLHEKLVVKGQARDAAEAALILQIVRDESIDNRGGLNGPGGVGGSGRGNAGDYNNSGFRGEDDDLLSSFIVNMLQVPGEFQVMLHVTIAELNRSHAREMGVNFNVLFDDGRHAIATAISGGVPTLSGIFENGDISVLINALAGNGTAKILSRPSLSTLSGYPARFLAGGEFAVPTVVGVGGAQAATTSFRGFGTSIVVTPTVVRGDLIRLQINPTFSKIDPNSSVNGIPGLNTRTIQTTVELREGQTIVLGGLLSRQTSTQVTRIPILGGIPWIGPVLFSSKRASEDELELLILVTPELIRAMDPEEVPPMPGYYVTHPNDYELYRYAMTEGAPDMEVYQLAPFGNGIGVPTPVGFNVFNPSPGTPQYAPIPQANQPPGYPTPRPQAQPQQIQPQQIQQRQIQQQFQPQQQFVNPQTQTMPAPNLNSPHMNVVPGMIRAPGQPQQQQQLPVQRGRSLAPPSRNGQPMLTPVPGPPTASRTQSRPNYAAQLFGQNNNSQTNTQYINYQNSPVRTQSGQIYRAGITQQR